MADTKPNRRGVLTAVAALTGAAALGATMPVSAVEPDPIFALLEACKRAKAEAREASKIHEQIADQIGDAAFPPHVEELDTAFWDAEKAVLRDKPTTPAGVIALLIFSAEYLADNLSTEWEVVRALVSAARTVAGVDASKIAISERLASVLEQHVEDGASA